jgi:hypothetical protein
MSEESSAAWAENVGCFGLALVAAAFVLALVWLCLGAPR